MIILGKISGVCKLRKLRPTEIITLLSEMKRQTTFPSGSTPTRTLSSVLVPIVTILAKISGGLIFRKLRKLRPIQIIKFLYEMKRQSTFPRRSTQTRTLSSVVIPVMIILAKISGGS